MNDEQLLRYARQIMLGDCDIDGQQAICDARIAVVGAGGLGSPVVLYLAAAGVGYLRLMDDDVVDRSNMQRQVAFTLADIDQSKVNVLKAAAQLRNPDVTVDAHQTRLNVANVDKLLADIDLIIDCSDNYATRFVINDFAIKANIPVVFGAATAWQGQIFVMRPRADRFPCYGCFNPSREELDASCALNGVLGPLVGLIGSVQALEALRLILGQNNADVLQIYDAKEGVWHSISMSVRPDCLCQTTGLDKM